MIRRLHPRMIVKGVRYLKHFGWKEFLAKVSERMEPEEVPYEPWYENYRPTEEELSRQMSRNWKNHRQFSILVPAYHTPLEYLRQMLDSVLAQTYPYWELCLVAAGEREKGKEKQTEDMRSVLADYARRDGRIRVKWLADNRGIAGNTQEALAMAEGEYVCFLDHDDLLSPAALYQLQAYLEKYPDTQLVYTDEDKVEENGAVLRHMTPNLKPDYNPDLLCANNYICHFLAVSRELALRAGGFREGYDGAQDHDFILRCCEQTERIGHVPEILYHWRVHSASTAENPLSKQYAAEAGRRAVEDHLRRTGCEAKVVCRKEPGFYRVIYPVKENSAVSVIIPSRDEKETLKQCLTSILEHTPEGRAEILVIENNSQKEETFAFYKEIDGKNGIRVLYWNQPFNYSAVNNFGAARAKGEYLLFLNNDTQVIHDGWLDEMLGVCQRPDTGAVGARLYYPDDTVQHAGIVIGIGGIAGSMCVGMKRSWTGYMNRAALMQDLSAVTGACMMVKRRAFEEAGGFEERLAIAFNDVDLCLKLGERGWRIVYDPYVELYHFESKTRGTEDTKEKVRRFQGEIEYMRSRWTAVLRDGDPCYNKNLSLTKWNYSLKAGERMR